MSPKATSSALDCLPRVGLSNNCYLVRLGENLTDRTRANDAEVQKLRAGKLYHKTGAWNTTYGNTKCIIRGEKLLCVNPRMARPPQGNVVIMHHVLSVHKSDGNYKRRLIWFWNDEAFPVRGVALVEYVGEEPEVIVPHENSTRNSYYLRTFVRMRTFVRILTCSKKSEQQNCASPTSDCTTD